MELGDVLKDEKEEKQELVEKETVDGVKQAHRAKEAQAVEEGRKRDEAGRFAKEEKEKAEAKEPKPDPKPEARTEELSAKERAAFAAMQDERRKRQELEQRLAQLEQAQKQQQNPPKPFMEDPDGALAQYHEQFQQHTQQLQQQMSGALVQTKVTATEAVARSQFKDYDEKVEVFKAVCQNTPGLYEQCLNAPNPADFAYRIGKNYHDLQQAGSLDQLKEKIEREARVKFEEEYKKKQEESAKQRAELPPSLSEARGTSQPRTQYTGPTPLGAILK
jgi:hypothetical protein